MLDIAKQSVETWLVDKNIVIGPTDDNMKELRAEFLADAIAEMHSDSPEIELDHATIAIQETVFSAVYMDKQAVTQLENK